MILTYDGRSGSTISLDTTETIGKRAEIDMFSFFIPPLQFRLVRNGIPITDWADGTCEDHDLQRGNLADWTERVSRLRSRAGCLTFHDPPHEVVEGVVTFGIHTKGLSMETNGMVGNFGLHVWPRIGTFPETGSCGS